MTMISGDDCGEAQRLPLGILWLENNGRGTSHQVQVSQQEL